MDEAAAAHRNMMEFYSWINQRGPGSRVDRSDDELMVAAAHPFPFFSQVTRDHERDDGADLVRRAHAFFGVRGFMVVVRPGADHSLEQAAIDAGLTLALDRYPEMVCSQPIAQWPVAEGFELRPVEDAGTAAAYWEMSSRAYVSLGCPPDLFDGFPPELLLAPEIQACVATREDEVVAGALVADVADNGYNIAVSSYVEAKDTRVAVDITALNVEIARIVAAQTHLRTEIDAIVADMEGVGR